MNNAEKKRGKQVRFIFVLNDTQNNYFYQQYQNTSANYSCCMRIITLLVLLWYLPFYATAQNATNNLQLYTNTGLNFTCSDPAELENDQTIAGAITLVVRTKSSNCSIYARMSSFLGPSGFVTGTYPIQLDWISDNSPNAGNLVTSAFTLTSSDQRLFTQSKTSKTYSFNYNLILKAPGYTYPPGHYNFTILFTMTQP